MSEWKDISTAPKDGTHFLAYMPSVYGNEDRCTQIEGCIHDDGFFESAYDEICFDADFYPQDYPTHWLPLPQPPRKPSLLADGTVDCPYNGQGVAPYKKQEGAE